MDRVRENDGVSAPPGLRFLASRRFGFVGSLAGLGFVDVSGGVAFVRLRSKGRRGVGRSRGGLSGPIVLVLDVLFLP